MATIKTMKTKPLRPEVTPPVTIDMDIVEYFYAATFEDIMGDNKLVDLILTNGFYKQAFCDAHGIEDLIINHKGKEHVLKGTAHNVRSTLDVLEGKTKIMVLNAIFENRELKNINKVTPLKDRGD